MTQPSPSALRKLDAVPVRIQRKRTKGWKAPAGAVYVGRGTPWGNPAVIGSWMCLGDPDLGSRFKMSWTRTDAANATERYEHIQTAAQAVDWFRRFLVANQIRDLEKLRGKDLMCFCKPDQPCHADVLLELANK
jgi:hypothetical protein